MRKFFKQLFCKHDLILKALRKGHVYYYRCSKCKIERWRATPLKVKK